MRTHGWIHWLKLIAVTLVVVWLVKAFLVTSCFIPSAGMENSLYQGEGVLVNKWSYGARVPFSSIWGYHRLGNCNVQKSDIVLFNDPGPESLCSAPEWRDVFISRCGGCPGDTLMLNHEGIETGRSVFSPDSKTLFVYPSSHEVLMQEVLLSVGLTDNKLISYTSDGDYIRSFSHYEYYLVSQRGKYLSLSPLNSKSAQDIHPYIVPRKGLSVKVYPWNAVLLGNTIWCHEHKQTSVKDDTLYVEGKPVSEYTFSKNYYWMISNDLVNLSDSRLFGFVPEECIIGKVWRIWFTTRKGRFFQNVQ